MTIQVIPLLSCKDHQTIQNYLDATPGGTVIQVYKGDDDIWYVLIQSPQSAA